MTIELHLWRSVITQAIADATTLAATGSSWKDKSDARAWFNSRSADFAKVCALAGLDPEAVREHAIDLIEQFDKKNADTLSNLGKSGRRKILTITARGRTLTLTEWSRLVSLPPNVIRGRLCNGWSIEKALSDPVGKGGRHIKQAA